MFQRWSMTGIYPSNFFWGKKTSNRVQLLSLAVAAACCPTGLNKGNVMWYCGCLRIPAPAGNYSQVWNTVNNWIMGFCPSPSWCRISSPSSVWWVDSWIKFRVCSCLKKKTKWVSTPFTDCSAADRFFFFPQGHSFVPTESSGVSAPLQRHGCSM